MKIQSNLWKFLPHQSYGKPSLAWQRQFIPLPLSGLFNIKSQCTMILKLEFY